MDQTKIEYVLEKGSGRINEDILVMEKNLFGVFDGATSLDHTFFNGCQTGGLIAADTAGQIFSRNHYPLDRLAGFANNAILAKMKTHKIRLNRPGSRWSTSAAVVRIVKDRLEWLQTGDSYILIIYEDNSHKVLVDQEDHDYETLCMLKKEKNKTLSNPVIKTQVAKIRSHMNKTYGVLNGDPRAEKFMHTGFIGLDHVQTILLFTDGLTLPSETPKKKKDFSPLVELFQDLGLKGLHQHIRKMEEQDPQSDKFPRFKCHDDIAAIAISPGN
ncbi:MAG: hypothetical protein GY710_04680 [Desulfobacteraceae bacterium]|nr:hypothetical protein [Desulfobacteraceae bacterium]